MWIVVQMDMYQDGGSCGSIFSGRLCDTFGPFDNRADAQSFKELKDEQNFYAQDFEVRQLSNPEL